MWILLLLFSAFALGGGLYAYRISFFSPKKGRDQRPSTASPQFDPYRPEMKRLYQQLMARECEIVTVRSHDGLILSGRYYHVADGAPLDICFHGYRSSWMTDFSGGSEISQQMGHNLLLIDQRAHGKSQGKTITFGLLERQDLLRWVEYANARFGSDTPIFLFGISMGGATVLMAPQNKLTPNVKGIIADCPYANALEIILHVAKKMPIPLWLVKPFVILGARLYGGFNLLETDARKELTNGKIPVLILHGEADTFVPPSMSDLVSCNPQHITRHTFPGASHGISCLVDRPRYQKIVMDFVEDALRTAE